MDWFKRIFTLPKAKNSLSDVLGADIDKAIKATAKALLIEAIDDAVSGFALVEGPINQLAAHVSARIQHELSGLSPELSAAIDQKVAEAFRGVKSVTTKEIVKVADLAVEAVSGLLKL